jgi:hypothetical protein
MITLGTKRQSRLYLSNQIRSYSESRRFYRFSTEDFRDVLAIILGTRILKERSNLV